MEFCNSFLRLLHSSLSFSRSCSRLCTFRSLFSFSNSQLAWVQLRLFITVKKTSKIIRFQSQSKECNSICKTLLNQPMPYKNIIFWRNWSLWQQGNVTLVKLLAQVVYFLGLKHGALLSRNALDIWHREKGSTSRKRHWKQKSQFMAKTHPIRQLAYFLHALKTSAFLPSHLYCYITYH